ncbi:MAG: KpsF/GutQ family sugar-phosphate isomerase [Sphingobium sp.]|jgi:arabinose-5-phosphate isomerase|nr:KpsF/GutQ family sugar-phosphate isomerase [Sphingobium sp.]MCI1754688.1 KpsF/GutQ family sugar-phosphate isomerase [Sphingobium sp.]MCI2053622.1 KpsF/GutQ family sugar-phosphate isomerase [Sphingobium sp.]
MELVKNLETDLVASARRVLATEAAALQALAGNIPADLLNAVDAILKSRGRVVVSGIGKSGHVGRKISATLASTGTPSYFVHAAEASHGDLGMIGTDDICLLLSNSGETSELRDILAFTRRFGIPLIAICAQQDSSLMRAADYRLLLPDAPEACPISLAPTTSTTMMMALGDALAVALMEARGFHARNFRELHPGGRLGAQLTKVGDLMHWGDELPVVRQDAPMAETLLAMTSKGFGIAIVVDDDGKIFGVVTDGDLRRNMEGLMERRAGEIATRDPSYADVDMLAGEALTLLNQRQISVLPVIDAARIPIGLLHVHDLLHVGVA